MKNTVNETTTKLQFSTSEKQKAWIKVSLYFLLFYFGEIFLFWQGGFELAAPIMKLPLAYPLIYPIGYWLAFGLSAFYAMKKNSSKTNNVLVKKFEKLKSFVLAMGITTGILGVTMIVMQGSGSVSLGHSAMFFAMFIMAVVLGAIELNIGWLSAAFIWLCTAFILYNHEGRLAIHVGGNVISISQMDIIIGLSISLGFFLIGKLPFYIKSPAQNA